MAFMLNAYHALRLVEKYDAYVSVEVHTDLASDINGSVEYAKRFHEICPERFIVKIPFTPAGVLATRKLSAMGIAINHTLGFSARQNYIAARIGRPEYVNVFMGRLNSFIEDNNLGSGAYVGEKATLASQAAILDLRLRNNVPSRQIGASFRSGEQVRDLAGIDVMTLPLKVAREFLALNMPLDQITDKTHMKYEPNIRQDISPKNFGLRTLWDIDDRVVACVDALEQENVDHFTADDLVEFFYRHGCEDVFIKWTDQQRAISYAEGKIPQIKHWWGPLADGSIGLDSLMNLAGISSFTADQNAMDNRVIEVLSGKNKGRS